MQVKLRFYVISYDFNANKIISYNVLNGWETTIKKIAKKAKSLEEFKEMMGREFRWHYWSRSEHEIMVGDIHNFCKAEKIDVWQQIDMNFDIIIDYIIDKMKLNFGGKKCK